MFSKHPKADILLKIYNATIRSIFKYASPCIVNAAETHLEKLVQNQALRVILMTQAYVAIKDLHDLSGLLEMKNHLKDFAKKRLQAMKGVSPLINKIMSVKQYYLANMYMNKHNGA